MRRSLSYFWRINLAVVAGAAIATAVLTGALLVGDSVRGSLRDLTLDRLGRIDFAITAGSYFREDIVIDLSDSAIFEQKFSSLASAILTNGSAINAVSKRRASKINIVAVDDQFISFFAEGFFAESFNDALSTPGGQPFPAIIINATLQKELQVNVGDALILRLEQPTDIARGSLLGDKSSEAILISKRYLVAKIIPDQGVGRFGIRPHQTLPKNAFVSLPVLQKTLDNPNTVNTIFLSARRNEETIDSHLVQRLLDRAIRFEDVGLRFQFIEDSTCISLTSKAGIMPPHIYKPLREAVNRLQMQHMTIFTYLANSIEVNDRRLPYSTVAAMPISQSYPFGSLLDKDGQRPSEPDARDIILNQWAADDLQAHPGDSVRMSYYVVGPRDELLTEYATFSVLDIVRMSGLGVDSTLTPDFPGMSKADNMADWRSPFPVDLSWIRSKDEAYWDKYKAAPKAFISGSTGSRLWGSRYGEVTSIRILPEPSANIDEAVNSLQNEFLNNSSASQFGFEVAALQQQGLAASGGATDFSGLFIGFSLFLIVSAVLLVALLFGLGVELRAKEIGLLLSVGYAQKTVLRQFLLEGVFLSVIGSSIGILGAIGYAWLIMTALRTWWIAAVGSPFLFLHVSQLSLLIGLVVSIATILCAIWLVLRKLHKIPTPRLLMGATSGEDKPKVRKFARIVASFALLIAIILSLTTLVAGSNNAGLFFAIGMLLLISGLAFFSSWLRGGHKMLSIGSGKPAVSVMAIRNTPRSPGRSMLSVALVASATFVIVAVGAFYRNFGVEMLQKESGTGGYPLLAESDIALHYDLNSEDGRFELGFSDTNSAVLRTASITPFRLRPGDDASCLNLYKINRPRILGVPDAQIKRGGFIFNQVAEQTENPWQLLHQESETNIIPTFGDLNSVLYILHLGLGKDLVMNNEFGEEIRLRFVGLLEKSIFQSELLISEENLLRHFPSVSGYAYFLIDCQVQNSSKVEASLESTLQDYGFDAVATLDQLRSFQEVENTYLSTFQTLGGFGLLLGTLGLGIILVRNVLERRGEFATMRAFGYRQSFLARMVLIENGFLLALGILTGTLSAFFAVLPHASHLPWFSLILTLFGIFIFGMLASAAAVRSIVKIPLLPALKKEV